MRVLVLYESNCGGETRATECIVRELIKLTGVHVKAFTSFSLVQTNSFNFFTWILFSVVRWLNVIIKNGRSNWVYTTTYTAGVAAALFKPLFHYKICLHYHGTRIPPLPHGLRGKTYITQAVKRASVLSLHQFFLWQTDLIIAPSQHTKKQLIKTFHQLKKKTIAVIPNGVDHSQFQPVSLIKKSKLRQKYHIPKTAKVILVVGRLHPQKEIDQLITIVHLLKQDFPSLILVIAHPKPKTEYEWSYREQLTQKVKRHNLETSIHWYVNPAHIEQLYQLADLVISLSRQEQFPLILLEALATKTLFMGKEIGETRSILSYIDERVLIKENGVEQIANRIKTILALPKKERQEITRRGLASVRNHTWQTTAQLITAQLEYFPA